eukprot:gene5375-3870_t
MSVVLHTSAGDLVIHLYFKECPQAAFNFLALCAAEYYAGARFLRHYPGAALQTGDPTNTGRGGDSVYSRIPSEDGRPELSACGPQRRFFDDEGYGSTSHSRRGVLSMAHKGSKRNTNASQFLILCGPQLAFDGEFTAFGEVDLCGCASGAFLVEDAPGDNGEASGEEVLRALEAACADVDENNLVRNTAVKITGATVLFNPFAEGVATL